ncbi:YdgH/BhsA/McbA family protein [Tatumella citrea]|uniref:YdgH/BhsA/McbA-like domain-containing protein n=1 Tax=Tatumella citrea TaxID=53336 RepID=A0A1Y0LDI5_TATCI|nr:DUF1471 domain-containing protein [Tatumella citrea]ARU95720.1 hypothetical protein A7K98_19570 [Tatumella citrea]ARU99760.1 hypothetical protein A7K99_19555 [Tatumella citrea]
MKGIFIAAILCLSTQPLLSHAATEINSSYQGSLVRLGSISVSGGTIDELTQKLSASADKYDADYFRITSMNTSSRGYATATLYNTAVRDL